MLHAPSSQAQNYALAPLTVTNDSEHGKDDWQQELQDTFDRAATTGRRVQLSAGIFRHSGILMARGIVITGMGDKTILEGTTRDEAAIVLTGEGPGISDVKLTFQATSRSEVDEASLIVVGDAQHFSIKGVSLDGSDCAGIFVLNSHHGIIAENDIRNTLADSIHMTGGSSDIMVKDNTTHFSGDDGIAVVSYEKYPKKADHISIFHNSVLDNKYARGISVVGGDSVVILDNFIRCNDGYAGVYIANEESFHTYGASQITVRDNTIKGCGGKWIGHGSIMIFSGYHVNENINIVNNTVIDAPDVGIMVLGKGNIGVSIKDNTIIHPGGEAIDQIDLDEPVSISGNKIEQSVAHTLFESMKSWLKGH